MCRERYLKALRCQNPDVIPHQIWLKHPEFIFEATGFNYDENPLLASLSFHRLFDVDNGGPVAVKDTPLPRCKAGSAEDGGQTTEEGFNTTWHTNRPFTEPEQLWNFDADPWGKDCEKAVEPDCAIKNFRWCFELDTWSNHRAEEEDSWARIEKLYPGKFTDARSFYCTSFMWAICIFGWDVFLMALGLDADKTGQTIERISDITARMYEYFAICEGAEFIVPHDDLCMTSGPVTSPDWYRKYIYPQYERIFSSVKKVGKKIIFLSDGDISKLASDVAMYVDGFIFESSTSAELMFEKFGKDKCLIGGIDVRPLTFGKPADVEREVSKALQMGFNCPGYVVACANTIPANVPIENVYAYFEAIEKYRHRK
ncbi:MAG: uroporphyrinogen decarboxylase family protein [Sedimentisphaerales bacterium]